jgi:hypothetical protein
MDVCLVPINRLMHRSTNGTVTLLAIAADHEPNHEPVGRCNILQAHAIRLSRL